MEIITKKRMMLFTGTIHPALGHEIADCLGIPVSEVELRRFASGEIYFRAKESVRGADVFVVQTHYEPVNEALMEQLIMIDAMKRASAKRITAVIPYYGYSRQDHKALSREPISAKLVADLLSTAGADRVVERRPALGTDPGLLRLRRSTTSPRCRSCRTTSRTSSACTATTSSWSRPTPAASRPRRSCASTCTPTWRSCTSAAAGTEAHKIEEMAVVGEVEGRPCVIVDDMIDTASTISAGVHVLAEMGAGPIYVGATHGIFSGKARQLLEEAPIEQVVVTNTLPIPEERQFDKLKVLSIAPLIASGLRAVFEDSSVSEIFGGDNQV